MQGFLSYTCIPELKTTTAMRLLAEGLAWQTLCITLPETFENRLDWTGTGLAGVALKPRNRTLTSLFFLCVYEQFVWS
ncbi:hypothetical protein HGM15179_012274, partial [Zosterops borbonicus]